MGARFSFFIVLFYLIIVTFNAEEIFLLESKGRGGGEGARNGWSSFTVSIFSGPPLLVVSAVNKL